MKFQKREFSHAPLALSFFIALAVFPLLSGASATGADWGTLKGQFVFAGDAEQPAKINVNTDSAYCGKHSLVDETLVVGENGALSNVFVYLYLKKGKTVDIHPDLESVGTEPVVLDNKGCRFVPHALLLRTGQPFEIRNSDAGIAHNTNLTLIKNSGFNQIVPNDAPLKKSFEKRESYASTVACNIHPWMRAHVLIRDNPYMAVSGSDGSFEIKNIPAGPHEFIFWHEAKGNMKKLSLGKSKTNNKGRAKLKIPATGTLDLGEIKVPPAVLGQ